MVKSFHFSLRYKPSQFIMKICFLTRHNPSNKSSWSGLAYHMFSYLKLFHSVEWIGKIQLSLLEKFRLKIYNRIFRYNKVGFWYYNRLYSKLYTRQIEEKIKKGNFDLIVAPNAPDYIAYLNTQVPIIYLNDATFHVFTDFYPSFFNLSSARKMEGNEMERNSIQKSRLIIYSSKLAAGSATIDYNGDSNKISVIDFGANVICEPGKSPFSLSSGRYEVWHLLFIGTDWDRKGGDTAIKTIIELRNMGLKCKLTIVGCAPKKYEPLEDVIIFPFLDRNKKEDYDKLYSLYLTTHLLILPTKADCTPIVFSDAASFGIPVITNDIGGISSVIYDGVNGFLLPLNSNEIDYANKIKSIFEDINCYKQMRQKSRHQYEIRLNWDVWIQKVNPLLQQLQ